MGKTDTKKAFTLAELMIVLTIIGILVAILLPSAFRSTPDENIMKFKKANNTLAMVIGELVANDKYFYEADLGKKYDNSDAPVGYFCQAFANIVSTKSVDCSSTVTSETYAPHVCDDWASNRDTYKGNLDTHCKSAAALALANEIVTTDDVHYYEVTADTFNRTPYNLKWDKVSTANTNGSFYRCYKVFCIDVDGPNKGEDPFGYGIRRDGKILNGIRADAWVKLSVQQKD